MWQFHYCSHKRSCASSPPSGHSLQTFNMKLATIIFTSFAASVTVASSSAAKENDVVRLRRSASQALSKATALGESYFWCCDCSHHQCSLTPLSYFTLNRTSKRSANVPWIRWWRTRRSWWSQVRFFLPSITRRWMFREQWQWQSWLRMRGMWIDCGCIGSLLLWCCLG